MFVWPRHGIGFNEQCLCMPINKCVWLRACYRYINHFHYRGLLAPFIFPSIPLLEVALLFPTLTSLCLLCRWDFGGLLLFTSAADWFEALAFRRLWIHAYASCWFTGVEFHWFGSIELVFWFWASLSLRATSKTLSDIISLH